MAQYKVTVIGYTGASSVASAWGLFLGGVDPLNQLEGSRLDTKSVKTNSFSDEVFEYKMMLSIKVIADSEPLAVRLVRSKLKLPAEINIIVDGKIK